MFNLTPYRMHHELNGYNPFHELEDLEKNFFGDNAIGAFKTDIREEDNAFILEADLPGFRREDIHVDIEGDCLTISAERKTESEEKDKKGNFLRRERSYGSFARSFDITGVKADEIKANFADGVLKLTMPKRMETLPSNHRIEIE